jgi:uncharacterized protein
MTKITGKAMNFLNWKHFCIVIILMGTGASAVFGDALEDATAAKNRGDYQQAIQLLQPLAAQGNADAQANLGSIYREGLGVPQDYTEALRLFLRAAEQNNPQALSALGSMYYNGQGVTTDFDEAVKWYQRGAERGSVVAQTAMGLMYFMGERVTKDYVEAHKWLGIAAAAGDVNAQGMLTLVANRLTAEQLTESENVIRTWQPAGP